MAHSAGPTHYMADRAGTACIAPQGQFEAGSFQEFSLTYTAGFFGIDDTGSLKIVHRFASDMGKPQFSEPNAANYVTAEASNGAVLALDYDGKRNVRPWDKTLSIRVVRGFLREGDRIVVRFGDRRSGSPGIRLQTFCEPTFEFKTLVDPWATYTYIELPDQPAISIVAGSPILYKLIGPTQRRLGQTFRLGFKGEDKWGNPSHLVEGRFFLRPSQPVEGLPTHIDVFRGNHATILTGLRCLTPGLLRIDVCDIDNRVVASCAPINITGGSEYESYWADLHGQSEETIGTNSARELIEFARDRAFLDVMSHQGNDFQITTPFWEELNRLTQEFNKEGNFIIFPGYEWSGNTGLGGDRNVLFANEGRPIHRSHHCLVEDLSDAATDAHTADALFEALKEEDCVVLAHIGGRYADIKMSHDVRIERSIEIHSDWGTFEWLLEDAFEQGYRVGIVANSDGHKGRHGASHPGASLFGAYGGLTCLLATDLSRPAIMAALRRRRHYATTGSRLHLDVNVHVPGGADVFDDDPAINGRVVGTQGRLEMGAIARTAVPTVEMRVELEAGAPIERLEIRNATNVVLTYQPEFVPATSRRIRILWEGAEYRGRGRQTIWDGDITVEGNTIERVVGINWWNVDKPLTLIDKHRLSWRYLTTGGFGGVEIWLGSASGGSLRLDTQLIKTVIAIDTIGRGDMCFEAGGLSRRIRCYRLPEHNEMVSVRAVVPITLARDRDNPLFVRVRMEDGHLCWSSPIYLIN